MHEFMVSMWRRIKKTNRKREEAEQKIIIIRIIMRYRFGSGFSLFKIERVLVVSCTLSINIHLPDDFSIIALQKRYKVTFLINSPMYTYIDFFLFERRNFEFDDIYSFHSTVNRIFCRTIQKKSSVFTTQMPWNNKNPTSNIPNGNKSKSSKLMILK